MVTMGLPLLLRVSPSHSTGYRLPVRFDLIQASCWPQYLHLDIRDRSTDVSFGIGLDPLGVLMSMILATGCDVLVFGIHEPMRFVAYNAETHCEKGHRVDACC